MMYVCDLSMKGNRHYQYDRYWNTGEPTEEGDYLIIFKNGMVKSVANLKEGFFWYTEPMHSIICQVGHDRILAWHKIPPYEEQKYIK